MELTLIAAPMVKIVLIILFYFYFKTKCKQKDAIFNNCLHIISKKWINVVFITNSIKYENNRSYRVFSDEEQICLPLLVEFIEKEMYYVERMHYLCDKC